MQSRGCRIKTALNLQDSCILARILVSFCRKGMQTAYPASPLNLFRNIIKTDVENIGRMENMPYDEEGDSYLCHAGKEVRWICDRRAKTVTGYI